MAQQALRAAEDIVAVVRDYYRAHGEDGILELDPE
jgi:hypothetical protein